MSDGSEQRRAIDWGRWAALLVAAVVTALSIRYNTFTPWGSDPAAYVEAAHRWADRRLLEPSPLPLTMAWTNGGAVTVPLGLRPGAVSGTDVSEYPAGLPVLMAAGLAAFGDGGDFLIAPLSAGLMVWCAFVLGRHLAGVWAGLLAAALVALSPITLVSAVQPMGDAPTAALWLLALVMSRRAGLVAPAAAGAAAGLAVIIRPNLAPLGLVIAGAVLATARRAGGWRATFGPFASYALMGSAGVATLLWLQATLYGGPLEPSYRGAAEWFAREHVPKNLAIHSRNLVAVHSPWIATALVAPAVFLRRRTVTASERVQAVVALACLAVVTVNVAIYLPYTPYPEPEYLRFLLLSVTLAFVLLAGASVRLAQSLTGRARWLAPLAFVPVLIVSLTPRAVLGYAFEMRDTVWRIVPLGRYVAAELPVNAVAFVYLHGTAMAHYTSAPVVRLDLIPPDALDRIAAELERHGFEPVLLIDDFEREFVRTRFAGSVLGQLDWPPRALSIHGPGSIGYWRAADHARHRRGERWPIDVLRLPPDEPRR